MFQTGYDPPFSYSLYSRILSGFTITLLCVSLEGVFFIVRPLPMILIIKVFIGCASGILALYQGLSAKIRAAEFCEDWFAVKSHGSSRRLSYSEIEDVVLVKGPWPNVVISILIRNEEEPLTLFMNVNSRTLGTDLYSWSKQKIDKLQEKSRPSS